MYLFSNFPPKLNLAHLRSITLDYNRVIKNRQFSCIVYKNITSFSRSVFPFKRFFQIQIQGLSTTVVRCDFYDYDVTQTFSYSAQSFNRDRSAVPCMCMYGEFAVRCYYQGGTRLVHHCYCTLCSVCMHNYHMHTQNILIICV